MKRQLKWMISLIFAAIIVQVNAQQVKHLSARDPHLKYRLAPHLQKRITRGNKNIHLRAVPPRMRKITIKQSIKH